MIKTNCAGCVWAILPKGCNLEKTIEYETIEDREYQYTPGYCRHKRSSKWVDKNVGINSSGESVLNEINRQDKIFSVIMVYSDIDSFKKTLSSVIDYGQSVSQIIISSQTTNEKDLKDIINLVKDCGKYWVLDNIVEKEYIEKDMKVNYSSRDVKNQWFIVLDSGDMLTKEMLDQINSWMDVVQANFVGFYMDEEDSLRIVTNKFAFRQLAGNVDSPWLEKIKKHENWKNICLQITR